MRDHREFAANLRRTTAIAPDMRFHSNSTGRTILCLGTPTPIANPQHPLDVRHLRTPILLVNALHDPSAGYTFATGVARHLGRHGVLLTYEGWGHGVYSRSPCAADAIDQYLIAGTLPRQGTRCPAVPPAEDTTRTGVADRTGTAWSW